MSRLNATRIVKDPSIRSYWPIVVRRLFASLNEVPWVSLTALSTLFGGAILFIYFRSIEHVPSDLSSLFGLGVTTSIVSLALVIGFALVLFSPTWIYQQGLSNSMVVHQKSRRFYMSVQLAGLQFGVVGVLLIYIAIQISACDEDPFWWFSSGALLSIWGLYSLVLVTTASVGWEKRLWSFWVAISIGCCGVLPFVVLRPIQLTLASTGDGAFFVLIGMSAFVIALNAFVAPKFGGSAAAVLAVVLAMYLLVVLPLSGSNPVVFPTMVAQLLGVREVKPQELRIPKKTCELVLSALGPTRPSKDVNCSTREWGAVTANVLSNVGDRWVIQINTQSASAGAGESYLRLTIPNQDVQVIKPKDDALPVKRRTSCEK